jgi:sugar phosphate isomerase/epimerase
MKIGAMNHPGRSLAAEIAWMAELKLDFIDLTLEPPAAATWQVKPAEVSALLKDHNLGVVGHTAYYLPIGSSFESLRRAAIEELKRALEAFAEIGARWMNVHPDRHAPFVDEPTVVARNIESLRQLVDFARPLKIGVMLENVPGWFNNATQLGPILEAVPELGLHLDIGHCNLDVPQNTAEELLTRYRHRLAHVHLHDNRGGHDDLHLALGMGTMDLPRYVRKVRASGYDDTITLEVFAPDRHYLAYSRERLREWWTAAGR